MTTYYSWSVDSTQSERLQVTVLIHSGDSDLLSSEYIGEFTMFFDNEEDIKKFFLEGLEELQEYSSIISELKSMVGGTE